MPSGKQELPRFPFSEPFSPYHPLLHKILPRIHKKTASAVFTFEESALGKSPPISIRAGKIFMKMAFLRPADEPLSFCPLTDDETPDRKALQHPGTRKSVKTIQNRSSHNVHPCRRKKSGVKKIFFPEDILSSGDQSLLFISYPVRLQYA
jgi:hypothetical protein